MEDQGHVRGIRCYFCGAYTPLPDDRNGNPYFRCRMCGGRAFAGYSRCGDIMRRDSVAIQLDQVGEVEEHAEVRAG